MLSNRFKRCVKIKKKNNGINLVNVIVYIVFGTVSISELVCWSLDKILKKKFSI